MGRRIVGSRLRLHRETVRNLSGRELAAVAGGTVASAILIGIWTIEENPETKPKTNAWSADDPGENVICHS